MSGNEEVWRGPPKVTAREELADFECVLIATIDGQDFGVLLEGTDDQFYPVFTNEETLNNYMMHIGPRMGLPGYWEVRKIEGKEIIEKFFQIIAEQGTRAMIDPVAVSDHHTKWRERVKVGDLWKYQDFENN